jgi:hypothetical protein
MCGPGRRGLGALGDGPAPAATAAQRSTAMQRQDPSGRDLYGETASMAAGSLNSRFIFAPDRTLARLAFSSRFLLLGDDNELPFAPKPRRRGDE